MLPDPTAPAPVAEVPGLTVVPGFGFITPEGVLISTVGLVARPCTRADLGASFVYVGEQVITTTATVQEIAAALASPSPVGAVGVTRSYCDRVHLSLDLLQIDAGRKLSDGQTEEWHVGEIRAFVDKVAERVR